MKIEKRSLTITVILFVFIASVNCSHDDTNEAPSNNAMEYSEQLNLSYGPDVRHKMDVYLPENRTSGTIVIVALHRGGFVARQKEELNMPVGILVDNRFAVININYRLVDTTGVFQQPIIHQPSPITITQQLEDIGL